MVEKQIILAAERKDEAEQICAKIGSFDRAESEVRYGGRYAVIKAQIQDLDQVKLKVLLAKFLLINRKFSYLTERIRFREFTTPICALISSLIYFDGVSEMKLMSRIMGNSDCYSLEGLHCFRMGALRESWAELVDLTNSLLNSGHSDSDIYNVASFMMASRIKGDKSLFIADFSSMLLTNVSKGGLVDVVNLYHDDRLNLVNAIIAECPTEVIVEKDKMDESLVSSLKNIVKIKMI